MKQITTLAFALLTINSFASTLTIIKKELIVKAAIIEATIKCTELYDWSNDPDVDSVYKCHTQAVINEASKSLGTILKVEAMNSVSRDVLFNSVEDAGVYKTKLILTYY